MGWPDPYDGEMENWGMEISNGTLVTCGVAPGSPLCEIYNLEDYVK